MEGRRAPPAHHIQDVRNITTPQIAPLNLALIDRSIFVLLHNDKTSCSGIIKPPGTFIAAEAAYRSGQGTRDM